MVGWVYSPTVGRRRRPRPPRSFPELSAWMRGLVDDAMGRGRSEPSTTGGPRLRRADGVALIGPPSFERTPTPSVGRDNARPDSSPETSASHALRAVQVSPEAPQLLMSSCISAAGTVNQRPFGARGISMLPIRKHGDNPARPRRRLAWHSATSRIWPTQSEAGETSAHATLAFNFGSQTAVRTPQNANA